VAALALMMLAQPALAGLVNGGFETGNLTGWTSEYYHNVGGGFANELEVKNTYHYTGSYALWGKAYVLGDGISYPDDDRTYTYAWSGYQNLTGAVSVSLYLTDFQTNPSPAFGWGYGQEIYLVISDGTKATARALIDNHENPWGSLFDAGRYTASTGSDGRTWYRFQLNMNDADFPGTGDHAELNAKLSELNLASAKVGVLWEALNWAGAQELWAGGAVDDVDVTLVPEPAALALTLLGLPLVLRRRS